MRFTATPMLAAAACAALLASCASDDNSEPAATQGAVVITTTSPASPDTAPAETDSSEPTPPTTGLLDPGLQPYIDLAVDDLSGRLDVGAEDISVVAAILTEWPDSSLGCPQPGMQYALVLTDGSLITLAIDGDTYDYHAGGDTTPFLCETATDKSPTVTISAP